MLPFLDVQKIKVFFRVAKPTFYKTANVMRKNEVKTSKDGRHKLQLATSCKEIVISNAKEHIK